MIATKIPRCGTSKNTQGLSQKIQAIYFKIQGTYFKIYALYFLSSQIFNVQQHTRGVQNALKIQKKRIRYKTYYSCFVAYGKTN